jgi:hypothetical protein
MTSFTSVVGKFLVASRKYGRSVPAVHPVGAAVFRRFIASQLMRSSDEVCRDINRIVFVDFACGDPRDKLKGTSGTNCTVNKAEARFNTSEKKRKDQNDEKDKKKDRGKPEEPPKEPEKKKGK